MKRAGQICAFLLMAVAGSAQRQMTVAQLEAFIKSSIQMKMPDRQVADYVGKIKLTNKLAERDVEELQGLGAGPRTVAALKTLSSASAGLIAPPPPEVKPAPVV